MNERLPAGWEGCTAEEAVFQLPDGNYQSIFWLRGQFHGMGWMKDRESSVMLAGDKERGLPVRPIYVDPTYLAAQVESRMKEVPPPTLKNAIISSLPIVMGVVSWPPEEP